MKNTDILINGEESMRNRRLEHRLQSIQKSRLLLDRINDALTVIAWPYPRGTTTGFASRPSAYCHCVCGPRRRKNWTLGLRC